MTMPSGITPSRTSRHSAISSLRARATIIVLRDRGAFSAGAGDTIAPERCPSGTAGTARPAAARHAAPARGHCRIGRSLSSRLIVPLLSGEPVTACRSRATARRSRRVAQAELLLVHVLPSRLSRCRCLDDARQQATPIERWIYDLLGKASLRDHAHDRAPARSISAPASPSSRYCTPGGAPCSRLQLGQSASAGRPLPSVACARSPSNPTSSSRSSALQAVPALEALRSSQQRTRPAGSPSCG